MTPPAPCTPPAVDYPTLPLPPCGTEGAADAEMSGGSSSEADVQQADDPPSTPRSTPRSTPTSTSRGDSTDAAAPAQCQDSAESAALAKRREKAKAKKRRQKEKRKADAEERLREEEEEKGDSEPAARGMTNKELRRRLAWTRRLVDRMDSELGYMEEIGMFDEVDAPLGEPDPDHPLWADEDHPLHLAGLDHPVWDDDSHPLWFHRPGHAQY